MNLLPQPSLIVKGEFHAGIKGGLTQERVWKASNGAMWAMSPPEARCFIVKIINYDYVPAPVKRITISTGDPREDIQIGGEKRLLHSIAVGEFHQWAFDAMPNFMEIAHALHEDRQKKEAAKARKKEKKNENGKKNEDGKKNESKEEKLGLFARAQKNLTARWTSSKDKITGYVQKKTKPLTDELKLQSAALEDFLEEKFSPWVQNERLVAELTSAKKLAANVFSWCVNFIKKLPVFIFKLLLHIIKGAARGFWRGLKSPFDKFSPVRHKNFHAIIELENGQIITTGKNVGVSLFFIEEKIMPRVFSPDELRRKENSSSELMQTLFDLLQIRCQPM